MAQHGVLLFESDPAARVQWRARTRKTFWRSPAGARSSWRSSTAAAAWLTYAECLLAVAEPTHEEAAHRVRHERLADTELPFLACGDLAVFKVFVDRGQDWVDLEAMATAGTTDWTRTFGVLASHLGAEDPRIRRLEDLLAAT